MERLDGELKGALADLKTKHPKTVQNTIDSELSQFPVAGRFSKVLKNKSDSDDSDDISLCKQKQCVISSSDDSDIQCTSTRIKQAFENWAGLGKENENPNVSKTRRSRYSILEPNDLTYNSRDIVLFRNGYESRQIKTGKRVHSTHYFRYSV